MGVSAAPLRSRSFIFVLVASLVPSAAPGFCATGAAPVVAGSDVGAGVVRVASAPLFPLVIGAVRSAEVGVVFEPAVGLAFGSVPAAPTVLVSLVTVVVVGSDAGGAEGRLSPQATIPSVHAAANNAFFIC